MSRSAMPPPSRSLRPPPNIAPHIAMRAAKVMPIAMAAATELVRMSRLRTWEISCASTPEISSQVRYCMSPSLTHTAACSGLRPVANAFGWGFGATYRRGIGMLARCARSRTVAKYWGYSCSDTSWARAAVMASLSLNQYEPPTVTRATTRPIVRPLVPPAIAPIAMMSPPSPANRAAVFALFSMVAFSGSGVWVTSPNHGATPLHPEGL